MYEQWMAGGREQMGGLLEAFIAADGGVESLWRHGGGSGMTIVRSGLTRAVSPLFFGVYSSCIMWFTRYD